MGPGFDSRRTQNYSFLAFFLGCFVIGNFFVGIWNGEMTRGNEKIWWKSVRIADIRGGKKGFFLGISCTVRNIYEEMKVSRYCLYIIEFRMKIYFSVEV
jgi:hypothetical protein